MCSVTHETGSFFYLSACINVHREKKKKHNVGLDLWKVTIGNDLPRIRTTWKPPEFAGSPTSIKTGKWCLKFHQLDSPIAPIFPNGMRSYSNPMPSYDFTPQPSPTVPWAPHLPLQQTSNPDLSSGPLSRWSVCSSCLQNIGNLWVITRGPHGLHSTVDIWWYMIYDIYDDIWYMIYMIIYVQVDITRHHYCGWLRNPAPPKGRLKVYK